MEKVVERFIRYSKIDTASDPKSESYPSTEKQYVLLNMLIDELKTLGIKDASIDKYGYVTGTIPANIPGNIPVVGLIAHVDTSPDFNSTGVNPQIIDNYDGMPVFLKNNVVIDPSEFPEILNYRGQSLITTDGTSLLGADDKAGVAEIITAADILMNNDKIKHGVIKICFTPDEEIGKGTDYFDVKKFGADFAYTLDGGELGELEFENFNAAYAKITVKGKSVHPGAAKNRMINASLVAYKLISLLPRDQRPEHTEKYEGFFHLLSVQGNVEKAEIEYLIRDHDAEKFSIKKKLLKEAIHFLNHEFGSDLVSVEMHDQYYNMREKIEPVMYVVEIAEKAMKLAGVQPKVRAIRGGTDGARLSYVGLPCPNLFSGGHNFHGPYEFIPIPSMLKAVEVILNICRLVPEIKK
ncbi:MAG: peptidase T [Prolixibacteraceae bacterium]|nr:peptidase T [Prolixibacteraceae bacterium]